MEGSIMRQYPRTALDKPVELTIGEQQIKVENPANNVSAGGVFVRQPDLPTGARVLVKIPVNSHFFEAEGQIRTGEPREAGAGIDFKNLNGANREVLDELIAELTLKGLPAA